VAIEYPDGTQLIITRTLPASPDRVFEAFTDAEQMSRWMVGT
jgi:uncharacterized protein YndB with AHSA1/START domain